MAPSVPLFDDEIDENLFFFFTFFCKLHTFNYILKLIIRKIFSRNTINYILSIFSYSAIKITDSEIDIITPFRKFKMYYKKRQ